MIGNGITPVEWTFFMSGAVKYLKDTNVSLKNYGLWKIILYVKNSSLSAAFWN